MKVRDLLRPISEGNTGPADDMSIAGPYDISNAMDSPTGEQEEASNGYVWWWEGETSQGKQDAFQEAGPFENRQQAMKWYRDNVDNNPNPETEGYTFRPYDPKLPIHDDIRNHEDPDEEYICSQCNGSGEGMYDGSTCRSCKGSGVQGGRREEPDPDYLRDKDQDDRMTGSGRYSRDY